MTGGRLVRCPRLYIAVAAASVAALLLAGGCAGRKEVRPSPPAAEAPAGPPGPKVALAPMDNHSNDLAASDIIRDAFLEGVSRRGYTVVPVAESDRALRESLGISYGGQLPTTTPDEVCKALGVDGVFYGVVQEFGKTTTGIYNSVTVAASFSLYRRDGTLAWKEEDRQVQRDVPRGGQNLGAEIVVKALGNLLLNPLTPHGKRVGGNIARKLPAGLIDNNTSSLGKE